MENPDHSDKIGHPVSRQGTHKSKESNEASRYAPLASKLAIAAASKTFVAELGKYPGMIAPEYALKELIGKN